MQAQEKRDARKEIGRIIEKWDLHALKKLKGIVKNMTEAMERERAAAPAAAAATAATAAAATKQQLMEKIEKLRQTLGIRRIPGDIPIVNDVEILKDELKKLEDQKTQQEKRRAELEKTWKDLLKFKADLRL
tara:strand:+ start:1556 stop:1951 length:396 start_codon:yes stop_codon:yes gene_type:complete